MVKMNQVSSIKNISHPPRTLFLLALLISVTMIGITAVPVYAKANGHGGGNGNGHGNSGRGNGNGNGNGGIGNSHDNGNDHSNNQNTGSSTDSTKNLITLIDGMKLSKGTTTSLDAKLDAATDALARGQTTAAKNMLNAFINEVNAQCCMNGKPLTTQQANQLTTAAQQIIQQLD